MKQRVFYGSGAKHLAAHYLSPTSDGGVRLDKFPSGERFCQFLDNIRGDDVFLVQSLSNPVNDNFMELLIMADAARRASAHRITFVMPYMGYQRQDRKTKPREPISAKLTIDMMGCAGAKRLVTIDAHNLCAQGFTNLPFDHLFGFNLFSSYLEYEWVNRNTGRTSCDYDSKNELVFVAPDIGAIKRAQTYAAALDVGFAIVNKKRLSPTEVKASSLIGDVSGKIVFLVDDMTESAGTLIEAAKICKQNGAKMVRVMVTHCCLTSGGKEALHNAIDSGIIDQFITTNTTDCSPEPDTFPSDRTRDYRKRYVVLDCHPLLTLAIDCIHNNKSLTELFDVKGF